MSYEIEARRKVECARKGCILRDTEGGRVNVGKLGATKNEKCQKARKIGRCTAYTEALEAST
jgi:hypothetical protein